MKEKLIELKAGINAAFDQLLRECENENGNIQSGGGEAEKTTAAQPETSAPANQEGTNSNETANEDTSNRNWQ